MRWGQTFVCQLQSTQLPLRIYSSVSLLWLCLLEKMLTPLRLIVVRNNNSRSKSREKRPCGSNSRSISKSKSDAITVPICCLASTPRDICRINTLLASTLNYQAMYFGCCTSPSLCNLVFLSLLSEMNEEGFG